MHVCSDHLSDRHGDRVTVGKMPMNENQVTEEDWSSGTGENEEAAPIVSCVSSVHRRQILMETSEVYD